MYDPEPPEGTAVKAFDCPTSMTEVEGVTETDTGALTVIDTGLDVTTAGVDALSVICSSKFHTPVVVLVVGEKVYVFEVAPPIEL